MLNSAIKRDKMKLIFMGKQGSGKGTQGKLISKELKIPHISTGKLLRNAKGNLKKEVDKYMDKGLLVPDKIILKVLNKKLKECNEGFILDGFPRTVEQAKKLDEITKIDKVFRIFISDEEALKRLSGRRYCENCGKMYNVNTQPKPREKGKCDKCGGWLVKRDDDTESSIKKRLLIYNEKTREVVDYYKEKEETDVLKIDGEKDIKKVKEEILENL